MIHVHPLRGGLESCGTARVRVEGHDRDFVVKAVSGRAAREIAIYRALGRGRVADIAPKLLGWRRAGAGAYAFLEWVPGADAWPWRDEKTVSLVLSQLARIHIHHPSPLSGFPRGWDYDAELRQSAQATVEACRVAFQSGVRPGRHARVRTVERLARSLPSIRRQLIDFTGTSLIHGDAHPGNAVITRRDGKAHAVLLDWGRARVGSPLEDVCSWVQTLAFWEPVVRKRHDSLLRSYRRARGLEDRLSREFRDACWLAGACNGFAGALRYHLAVAMDPCVTGKQRTESLHAAADWLRIMRRAEACWRN